MSGADACWQPLTHALVAIARAKVGIVLSVAELTRLSWKAPAFAPSPIGLLRDGGWEEFRENQVRFVGPLRALLEEQGVDFWTEIDEGWRLVDTRWLDCDSDAYRWVHTPVVLGHACRFCGAVENSRFPLLEALQTERRNGRYIHRPDGRLLPDFCGSRAGLLHRRCIPRWIATCLKIEHYLSLAEASAADKKAGRRPRFDVQTSAHVLEATKGAAT